MWLQLVGCLSATFWCESQLKALNVNVICQVWYKCQPRTCSWFAEMLTGVTSWRRGWEISWWTQRSSVTWWCRDILNDLLNYKTLSNLIWLFNMSTRLLLDIETCFCPRRCFNSCRWVSALRYLNSLHTVFVFCFSEIFIDLFGKIFLSGQIWEAELSFVVCCWITEGCCFLLNSGIFIFWWILFEVFSPEPAKKTPRTKSSCWIF